jgi:two-component system cell cycle sensor histidine kinase/response regulator CckA
VSPEDARSNSDVGPLTGSTGPPEEDFGQALRKRAEARAAEIPEDLLAPEDAPRALHELRVHQIELEMQNEELRRAQQELEVSRARYFDLFDLAPVGYVTLSEKGLILEVNLTAAGLLGMARAALVTQPLSRFVFREDQDRYYLHRKALQETSAPQAWELRMLKNDAAPFWVRIEATAARDAEGNFICRAALSDITRRKFEEEETARLEAQNRQLQKAEGLGRMAGAIAHHFNNYFTSVMGNLELTLDELPPGSKTTERLREALQATSEAAKVSAAMLTYLGQTRARHDRLDLAALCRQSLPLLRAAMPKSVVLTSDLPSVGPAVIADANQIQQVLANLVTNAWEAGGDSRSVNLTVKTVSPADFAVSRFPIEWSPRESAYACLEVTDTGCGIADKDIDRLFDPFFSSKFTGRGLGLPVVLGIVRSHGGAVTVDSRPGRGSTFRVFLPVSAPKVLTQPDQAPESPVTGFSGTVLLVEDEEMVRRVFQSALTSLGFKIITAKDGIEAVELFRRHQDEVRGVLCDLTMPRMDGWQTLAALRKLAPGLPVILTSGYDEAEVMAGDHAERPQAFLSKPFHFQGLRDAVGIALSHGRQPGDS